MFSRRDFLKSSSLISLAPSLPAFMARTAQAVEADKCQRILVVVQLDGGNDGLNTVVPIADPEYGKLRTRLRIAKKDVVTLSDSLGLHPMLRPLDKLLQAGQLTVIPGVGYPNPNRSHFDSMAIWHTARFDAEERKGYGWIGRALDPAAASSYMVGGPVPPALRGRRSAAISLNRPDDLTLAESAPFKQALGAEPACDLLAFVRRQGAEAVAVSNQFGKQDRDKPDAFNPRAGLAARLNLIGRLLKADPRARVFYTTQTGYDTHADQLHAHSQLLSGFATAVATFFQDLQAAKLAERVTLLAFSEFGRTIKENASGGTDHGTAGTVFLAGPGLKGGIAGMMPSLTDLVEGEPKMTTDFRRIYATILESWLGLSSAEVLAGKFDALELFVG
jgi:uncharacterized protein (DUF1501 family)